MTKVIICGSEKSSQSLDSFQTLSDDNRAVSEIICRTQEDKSYENNSFLGVKLYKNRQVCLINRRHN